MRTTRKVISLQNLAFRNLFSRRQVMAKMSFSKLKSEQILKQATKTLHEIKVPA